MKSSRRDFLVGGASAVAAGVVGTTVVGCKEEAKAPAPAAEKTMVAACGLSCTACPLLKDGKCKGCAPGNEASAELLKMKPCPVLQCAAMKKIDYCGTGCKAFTTCQKLIGKPYDKSFMEMMAKRMAATT